MNCPASSNYSKFCTDILTETTSTALIGSKNRKNKENIAGNITEATNIVVPKKIRGEDEQSCTEMEKSKAKERQEVQTAHNTREGEKKKDLLSTATKNTNTQSQRKVKTSGETELKQRKQHQTSQSLQQKSESKGNNPGNITEATNFVELAKIKEENKKLCTEMDKNKTETRREVRTAHGIRYKDSIKHMPGTNRKRQRCKFDGCNLLSSFYCILCDVHLCIKSNAENTQENNCFLKYHELPE